MKEDVYPKLVENEYYHIYNRGNNRDDIFYSKENYRYFLQKYDEYLSPFLDTFAYCLLPNHFHILAKVKSGEEVIVAARFFKFLKLGKSMDSKDEIISEAFRRFFMSYAKAINKKEGRVGSLFQKNFKRKYIGNEKYFRAVVHYIHANPQKHGICQDFKEYPYSSYQRMLLELPSKLKKQELIEWFDSKENFVRFHQNQRMDISKLENNSYGIEDPH